MKTEYVVGDKDLNSIIDCVENGEITMVTTMINLWKDILCLKEENLELKELL